MHTRLAHVRRFWAVVALVLIAAFAGQSDTQAVPLYEGERCESCGGDHWPPS